MLFGRSVPIVSKAINTVVLQRNSHDGSESGERLHPSQLALDKYDQQGTDPAFLRASW